MEIKFDIIEYLGKTNNGIFVLLSLSYDDEFYDAIFYYKEKLVALTIDKKLEIILGCEIEDWSDYNKLMLQIISKVLPYDEAKNIVNEFDKNLYQIYFPNEN